ncbi:MAG TPA: BBP7 family outer membrane beta-barrel protein [Gemmataceae bacterium]|nr:BBP7 family outer membrane beta-barrel protein [Gemmataceae bacterium]
MSARTLAAAVMTAALAGPATAQMPPHPLPLGGGAGPAVAPIPPGVPPGAEYAPPGFGYPAGGYPAGGCPPGLLDEIGQHRGPKSWIGAEYLLYWTKNMPLGTPIATGGPAGGFATLGAAGTQVVLGNEDINFREQHGLRIHGGTWLTDAWAVEASLFLLPSKDFTLGPVTATDTLPTLARPFFDTSVRGQNVRLISRPGAFTGSVKAEATTGLWGGEIGPVLRMVDRGGSYTLDGIFAFKHVSLEESLQITDSARAGPLGVANFNGTAFRNGTTTFVEDYFSTTNRIYAATIGGRLNLHVDAFTLSLTSKLGLGVNEQSVRADGSTHLIGTNPFLAPVKVGGGLLAVGPNVGKFSRSDFVYMPELNLNLAVQLTPHLTLSFGYNFLYISDVVRPGDQLASPINPVFIPTSQNFGGQFGQKLPAAEFNTSSYWANGFNLGLAVGF